MKKIDTDLKNEEKDLTIVWTESPINSEVERKFESFDYSREESFFSSNIEAKSLISTILNNTDSQVTSAG